MPSTPFVSVTAARLPSDHCTAKFILPRRLALVSIGLGFFTVRALGQSPIVSHTIQITNDADDGYYNNQDGSGWHSTPQSGGADLVGSWSGTTTAWVAGYRFPSTGINSGDTIRSAYLVLVSSDGSASSSTCGSAPCPASNSTFRVYGVAQDDGPSFSGAAGNTPLDVPYTTAYHRLHNNGTGRCSWKLPGEQQRTEYLHPYHRCDEHREGKLPPGQGGRTPLPCGLSC